MLKQWSRLFFLSILSMSLFIGLPSVWAHGGGTIAVQPAVAPAGTDVLLQGEELEANSELQITLSGLSYETKLGVATVGIDGTLQLTLSLPKDTPAGVYQIQATSADDDVYTTEITINAVSGTTPALSQATEPSAEPMQLDRTRTPWEWAVILFAIISSASLGLLLVLRK